MIVMFSSSFYTEYELYKTSDPAQLIKDAKKAYIDGVAIETPGATCIGCQFDFDIDQALKISDKVVFMDDLEGVNYGIQRSVKKSAKKIRLNAR